jgi:hypothetical protein
LKDALCAAVIQKAAVITGRKAVLKNLRLIVPHRLFHGMAMGSGSSASKQHPSVRDETSSIPPATYFITK